MSGILACEVLCWNRQIWPAQNMRPEARRSPEDSRSHRWGCHPSPAWRTASEWRLGSTRPPHLLGRTWRGTWTVEGFLSSPPETKPFKWQENNIVDCSLRSAVTTHVSQGLSQVWEDYANLIMTLPHHIIFLLKAASLEMKNTSLEISFDKVWPQSGDTGARITFLFWKRSVSYT